MGDLSVEIFSSATGVTKIDVFHPDPIEQLWHGSRVLDYLDTDEDSLINNYPGYVNGGGCAMSMEVGAINRRNSGILTMGLKVSDEWIRYVHKYGSRLTISFMLH